MKLTRSTLVLIIVLALGTMGALVIDGGSSSSPNCLEVANASVHAYYQPEFEAAVVGWFVEGEPLKYKRTDGIWTLVSGNGTDAGLHKARMTGWVQSSYLSGCK